MGKGTLSRELLTATTQVTENGGGTSVIDPTAKRHSHSPVTETGKATGKVGVGDGHQELGLEPRQV